MLVSLSAVAMDWKIALLYVVNVLFQGKISIKCARSALSVLRRRRGIYGTSSGGFAFYRVGFIGLRCGFGKHRGVILKL